MPDVANRHADAQLTAPRLGAGGVKHAGTQHAELKLADAALHAEKKPIIGSARVVNPIQVDHSRLDRPRMAHHSPALWGQARPVPLRSAEPLDWCSRAVLTRRMTVCSSGVLLLLKMA